MERSDAILHTTLNHLQTKDFLLKESKSKAQEIRNNLRNIEASSGRLTLHYTKAQNNINEVFQFYTNVLEDRKIELLSELESQYSCKQVEKNLFIVWPFD